MIKFLYVVFYTIMFRRARKEAATFFRKQKDMHDARDSLDRETQYYLQQIGKWSK